MWLLAVLLIAIASPSPSPPATGTASTIPSQDDIYRSWQLIAPQERASEQRYRAAMQGAIGAHRSQIVAAVAGYVMAERPDQDALVKAIDALLTPDERRAIGTATELRLSDQQNLSDRASDYLKQRYPGLRDTPAPQESPPPGATTAIGPDRAAKIIANWLLTPRTRPVDKMTVAEMRTTTPLQMHGPGDEAIRAQLRDELLNALSPGHRSQAGNLIAQYTVAADPDKALLAKQLDAMLTSNEQQRILHAYAAFANRQKASADESRSRFERMLAQIAPDQRPAMLLPPMSVVDSLQDADAGFVLPDSLLTSPMTVRLTTTP